MEKLATTDVPIHDLLARRWSPRAFDERPVEAGAGAVDVVGEELLADSRLAHEEDRRVGARNRVDTRQDGSHPRAVGHDGERWRCVHATTGVVTGEQPRAARRHGRAVCGRHCSRTAGSWRACSLC